MLRIFYCESLMLLAIIASNEAITCPTQWQKLTSRFEIFSPLDCMLSFAVHRTTYVCSSDNKAFKTNRSLIKPSSATCNNSPDFGICDGDCKIKAIQIGLNCTKQANHRTCAFKYVNKNCDRVSWSEWEAMTSCTGSNYTTFRSRTCLDCDGIKVGEEHCPGNATDQTECEVFWSQWAPWSACDFADTAAAGIRTRTRKCYYESAEEIFENVPLCQHSMKFQTKTCHIPIATAGIATDISTALTSATYGSTLREELNTNADFASKNMIHTAVHSFSAQPFDRTHLTNTNSTSMIVKTDINFQQSNYFLRLFLWVTIPVAVLFLISFTALLALISCNIKCTARDPEKATPAHRNIIGPLNEDLYSCVSK